jgi:hypothetical protein
VRRYAWGVTEPLDPPYGERVVSWRAIELELRPDPAIGPEFAELASGIYRLRGLVMAQGAETEAVLGQIVSELDPAADVSSMTAGRLLIKVRELLASDLRSSWYDALNRMSSAITARNRAVHSDVTIGSTWVPYETGGGEFVPVISLMGHDDYDESDLRRDLVLQQEATVLAVGLLLAIQEPAPPRSDIASADA